MSAWIDQEASPLPPRRRVSLRLKLAACLLRLRCPLCGLPLIAEPGAAPADSGPDGGGEVEWDHEIALGLGGRHVAANIRPLHAACHKLKSAADAAKIAKVNRLAERTGQRARRRRRAKHGKGPRPIPSRPLLGNRDSPFKKRLDGRVERRRPLYP